MTPTLTLQDGVLRCHVACLIFIYLFSIFISGLPPPEHRSPVVIIFPLY